MNRIIEQLKLLALLLITSNQKCKTNVTKEKEIKEKDRVMPFTRTSRKIY
jgi:hypothetical protein